MGLKNSLAQETTAETLDMRPTVDVASSSGKFWRIGASARKWPVAGGQREEGKAGAGRAQKEHGINMIWKLVSEG